MFGWIPIIGPIIQGLFGFLNKVQDKEITKIKTAGEVTVAETQASAQIIHDTSDDIGVRFTRDILIFPWALYGGLTGWDYTIAKSYPSLVFNTTVVPPESGLTYLPYMVFVFLLGNVGLNMWKRR